MFQPTLTVLAGPTAVNGYGVLCIRENYRTMAVLCFALLLVIL